ncbi:MAG TPA: AAA family ATPase [Nannocystaceae bacterium]|nr:AAA family ATPase [Nannocystaceae bacterium]
MTRPTLRVHLATHHDGRITGRLVAAVDPGRVPPPTAYGTSDEQVLSQLALALEESVPDVQPYRWTETLQMRTIDVQVHPQSIVHKRIVIGRDHLSVSIGYAWAALPRGGFKVVIPMLGWTFVLEDMEIAAEVIGQSLASALLGERAAEVYALRDVASERVIEWAPTLGRKGRAHRFGAGTSRTPTLDAVAEDWIERERRRRGRRLVGHFDFSRELPLLESRPPRSLLLVGPSGAGKTSWVRALARVLGKRRSDGITPKIWATSADRIVAGMAYLGMWEKRCLDLVEELSGEDDILYFERLAPVLAAQTGRSSIADLLLPAVVSGEIALLAECTHEELDQLTRRAPALLAGFHHVRIEPTPAAAMPPLLAAYQERENRALRIDGAGLRRLVQHLELLQRDIAFPGKGFRFLDALNKLHGAELDASASANDDDDGSTPAPDATVLDAEGISREFARTTGLPLELVSDARRASREHVAAQLRRGVIGQDEACSAAARVLTRLKAGLNDPERPIGSLFFVGPTGVGKTELAKQLARYMFGDADRMIRVDMSEYMLPGAAQRLLASGRGLRSLVDQVRERPLGLVLFDEIEKAHPEVFDLLLGLLGEGRLTDVDGRLVDFRMTLVVMTSNLGVAGRSGSGFDDREQAGAEVLAAVRAHFRPEFWNRIDHVIAFRALSMDDIRSVVQLELAKVAERVGLVRRRLRLRVSEDARGMLARLGWHPTRGARPLKRVIEDRIVAPIAVLVAEDPSIADREIHVVLASADDLANRRARGEIVIALDDAIGA